MGNLKKSPVLEVDNDTQVTCIDLPGQPIQCVRTKPKLRVVLRKHRDVVFDIKLGSGGSYTVESDKSYFYSERDSELVRHGKPVSFQDGERLHLWVARTFTGKLLLKKNGQLIAQYEPNEIDPFTCTAQNPEGKPAPLIVSIQMPSATSAAMQGSRSVSAELLEDMQTMHVIEADTSLDRLPKRLKAHLESGSQETTIDSNNAEELEWVASQIVGLATYRYDNRKWINDLKGQSFYIRKRVSKKSGKVVLDIIFSGNPKIRTILKKSRYSIHDPRVFVITGGAGSLKNVRHTAWNNVKGIFKGSAVVMVVLSISDHVGDWLGNFSQLDASTGEPLYSLTKLFTKIGIDIAKLGISAAILSATIAGLVTIATSIAAGALVTLGLILIGVVVVAFLIDLTLSKIDEQLGFSDTLVAAAEGSIKYLGKKITKDYQNYDSLLDSDFGWGVAP